MFKFKKTILLLLFLFGVIQNLSASKLCETKVVDKDYLMLHFKDGIVTFVDNGQGATAYTDKVENATALYQDASKLKNTLLTGTAYDKLMEFHMKFHQLQDDSAIKSSKDGWLMKVARMIDGALSQWFGYKSSLASNPAGLFHNVKLSTLDYAAQCRKIYQNEGDQLSQDGLVLALHKKLPFKHENLDTVNNVIDELTNEADKPLRAAMLKYRHDLRVDRVAALQEQHRLDTSQAEQVLNKIEQKHDGNAINAQDFENFVIPESNKPRLKGTQSFNG